MRIAVVGNGLMGSAAGRHLTMAGHEVVIIGPGEPADHASHHGVFASHYDEGRLVSAVSRDPVWSALQAASIPQYDALTAQTGISILHRVGRVSAFRLGASARPRLLSWIAEVDPTGDIIGLSPPGDDAWRDTAPMVEFPDGFDVLVERGDSGYLNPRSLIRAQNSVAETMGAVVLRERVLHVDARNTGVSVTTESGEVHAVDRVLVAAGAFTNAPGLLPSPLPLRCKTETTIWADLSDSAAVSLAGMPVVTCDVETDGVDDIYLAPPVRYPDGVMRLKMGANTAHETWPTDTQQIAEWFRSGDSDADVPALEAVLRSLVTGADIGAVAGHRCIITYTPSKYPIIDAAPGDASGRLFVATGGNGTSAQCSDALGQVAAARVIDRGLDDWPISIDPAVFGAEQQWGDAPRDASRAQRRAFLQGSQ